MTVPRRGKAGLWVETKHGKNGLTDEQKAFRAAHEEEYDFAVCYTVEAFIKAVREYLNDENSK